VLLFAVNLCFRDFANTVIPLIFMTIPVVLLRSSRYKDAFSDPRHLPRVDANFFRMFQLIERFVDDEKGREVQRKREKQMMRDELCDLRKAVWRY
jgi:hypothetical protein